MKRIALLLTVIATFMAAETFAQVRTGVKGGINLIEMAPDPVTIVDEGGSSVYAMSVDKSKIGVHIGFFVQAEIGPVFIQPEILFNTQSIDYRFEGLQPDLDVEIRDENYQTLDFPITVGLKFGPVRFGGGMTGHLFLNSNSDIDDFLGTDYEANFNTLSWGWHGGIGLDIWKLHIDARYEGLLDNWGNHMTFYGNDYEFNDKPGRIVVSLGISF